MFYFIFLSLNYKLKKLNQFILVRYKFILTIKLIKQSFLIMFNFIEITLKSKSQQSSRLKVVYINE